MANKKITIIDGNSLLFRAYFATAYPGAEIMRSQDGTPTNAVFAFSNMMNKIISTIKPGEGFIVAFDTGKATFRKQEMESYKANRKPAPEDLIKQFPIARELLRSLGIYQYEKEGFEGDDIAGTVATMAEKEGYDVHLYTSDRDFLQLVKDNVTVHILKKGLSDVAIMTPDKVEEEWGFKPLQIIDYKGLRGDSSDNLPGIPGVGEKTAVKLIQEYGSFDEIIAHAHEIKGKIGESIVANAEIGRLSRDLAIIKTDVELPFTTNDLIYEGYDFDSLNEFCQKYGFKSLMNKIDTKWKKKDYAKEKIDFIQIHRTDDIKFSNVLSLAVDFSNNDYTNSDIYGIAFVNDGKCYYIDIEDAKNDEKFLSVLKDENVSKYCFDYKAIKVGLSFFGIEINGLKFDILIAAYLIDSSFKNGAEAVMQLFGVDIASGEEETISLFSVNNPDKTVKIAYFSEKLKDKAYEELNKIDAVKLFEELEMPLTTTLANMEIEGFPLSVSTLNSYGDTYKAKIKELADEIYLMAGEEFNISSPKQIGDILFNKLGIKAPNKKLSTSVDVLKEIADEHPIVNKILEYRKYFKLFSTYVEGIKNHIHEDGKIHAKFNQAQTATGRLSSSDPNLQNISIRDEESKLIRKAFYYPNHEFEILSLDYSQIELRVLASLSNCQGLLDIFNRQEDIHSATAKTIFHLDGEPSSLQRRQAKTVNFGIVYGISDWGLAKELGVGVYEARSLIDSFHHSFPEVGEFFNKIINQALKDGYVSTLFNRRRYLRELHDSNYQTREFAKRAAMNAPIQGTAADLIKHAMIYVDKALKEGGYQTKMVLQIHDELIFKVPVNEKEKVFSLIKDIMEHAINFCVPLEVDGGFGTDWYSAK